MFCLVGSLVWWDALFGWMLCLVGCFVRRDALFGGEVIFVGNICLFGGTVFVLVGGVLCTGVDVLYGVIFCLLQCVVLGGMLCFWWFGSWF